MEFQLGLGAGPPEIRRSTAHQQWRFTGEDGNWTVVLQQDFVALETRAYEDFDDFLSRLRKLLDALVEYIQPAKLARVGLRYVNEIRTSDTNWRKAIRAELLGPLVSQELGGEVEQSLQQVLLRYSGGHGIHVRHGLLPGGTTVQPAPGREPPGEPFYVLDYDAFREFPGPRFGPAVDPGQICEAVAGYNEAIYRLFRWSITDEYARSLGEQIGD